MTRMLAAIAWASVKSSDPWRSHCSRSQAPGSLHVRLATNFLRRGSTRHRVRQRRALRQPLDRGSWRRAKLVTNPTFKDLVRPSMTQFRVPTSNGPFERNRISTSPGAGAPDQGSSKQATLSATMSGSTSLPGAAERLRSRSRHESPRSGARARPLYKLDLHYTGKSNSDVTQLG